MGQSREETAQKYLAIRALYAFAICKLEGLSLAAKLMKRILVVFLFLTASAAFAIPGGAVFLGYSPLYHGVRSYSTSTTQSNHVSATVTDNSGQVSQISRSMELWRARRQTEHAIPYEVNYDVLSSRLNKRPVGTWICKLR
jgi:hypothetical protein